MASPRTGRDDEIHNQSPPFVDVNFFTSDLALREAVAREGDASAAGELEAFGKLAGSAGALDLGRLANEHPPRLRSHDPQGRRIDHVEFHPAYHRLMAMAAQQGLHCSPFEHLAQGGEPRKGAHVMRCAGSYMAAQMEPGHGCPITMTHAALAVLPQELSLARDWVPKIVVRGYDPRRAPIAHKTALTVGMGMTERQGGSDVRSNMTVAHAGNGAGPGAPYVLSGHKWFLSAPMSDGFLMLAQAKEGLSCFLVPRLTPNGTLNGLRILRLKDKLGNRANASAEVELERAVGFRVGEEGRGVATIIDMVTLTRLDCAVASAGLMRQALARGIHHARHRVAFQRRLVDQPLMTRVLADMALDVEAATVLSLRLARAFDETDEAASAYRRLMTPVTKYWVCKIASPLITEAMECLGGNGYVEEGGFPRLYREAPVNAIWEGSGNIMGLDVLRVLERSPETLERVLADLSELAQGERRLTAAIGRLRKLAAETKNDPSGARVLVELLALTKAGALLNAHAPPAVTDAFLATRLGGTWRHTYGASLAPVDAPAIVARAAPALG